MPLEHQYFQKEEEECRRGRLFGHSFNDKIIPCQKEGIFCTIISKGDFRTHIAVH